MLLRVDSLFYAACVHREEAKRGEREKEDKKEFFAKKGRDEKRKADGGRYAKKQRRE